MENEKCYSCQGKGFYTQIHGIHGAEDFGGDGFNTLPTIHEYPCSACAGTGLKKVSPMPDTKTTKEEKCNAEKNGVKCRPPCKTCYGGAIITPSTREEEWEQEFDKEAEIKDFIRSLLTEERRLAQVEILQELLNSVGSQHWRHIQEETGCGVATAMTQANINSEIWQLIDAWICSKGLSLTNLSKNK